jgi:hypothetical protein
MATFPIYQRPAARRHGSRTFDAILPPTFSHLISPARRNILAPAGKIILE